MEDIVKVIPKTIEDINNALETDKWLSNKYLTEWSNEKRKIIDRDAPTTVFFQDARYNDLKLDESLTEAYTEIDALEAKIGKISFDVKALMLEIRTTFMNENPAFEPVEEALTTYTKYLTDMVSIRNEDKTRYPNILIIDNKLGGFRNNAIKTAAITYTTDTASLKSNIELFISKDCGKYRESTEYLKLYVEMIVRTLQTAKCDLRSAVVLLKSISNTYYQNKKYFTNSKEYNFY